MLQLLQDYCKQGASSTEEGNISNQCSLKTILGQNAEVWLVT